MGVFMDYASTTPLSRAAFDAMTPFFTDNFYNSSAVYAGGVRAKREREDARASIARLLGARRNDIFFTSGGTEADNWALFGAAELRKSRGKHIITTEIEHSAVFRTAQRLAETGYDVTFLRPDSRGQVSTEALLGALREDTILVSIMLANNEVGTVLPVGELARAVHGFRWDILFHTDAVQAVGHIPVDVGALDVDLLSLSAHKFGGPKGAGALYMDVRRVVLPPLHFGGGQESGRRSGTENVPGIAGMAAALRESVLCLEEESARLSALRDRLIEGVLSRIPGSELTGDPRSRLPGCASFVFEGLDMKPLIARLDSDFGIMASQGSACSAGSGDPSRILLSLGLSEELARASLRLTLGTGTTQDDTDYVAERLPLLVSILRKQ